MQPSLNGLTSLDAAVLMERAILLNGMLQHGTQEQKVYAKSEWFKLETQLLQHINQDAIEMAKREMVLDHENLSFSALNELI